jgi:hypothetical protein
LQVIGTYYVAHDLKDASATYGVFGLVLGAIAWIYLGALVVVMSAEYSAVRAKKLWPRSLLTPFTDNVRLTEGDRRAYASYPMTEKHKGFETVEVEFHEPGADGEANGSGEAPDRGDGAGPDGTADPDAADVPSGPDQPARPGPAGSGG